MFLQGVPHAVGVCACVHNPLQVMNYLLSLHISLSQTRVRRTPRRI